MRRTLVADEGTRAACAHVLVEHQLSSFLQAEQLLKLHRTHSGDRAKVLPEGGWTHICLCGKLVHSYGLGEVLLDLRYGFDNLLPGVCGRDQLPQMCEMLKSNHDVELTLFLRHPKRLKGGVPKNSTVVQGMWSTVSSCITPWPAEDIVYANLTGGDIDAQAANIVKAMNAAGVKRLIFVASLEIYDEVPGKFGAWNRREIGPYLPPFRRAADVIEASGVDYTILRPAWLTDKDEVDYETTERE